MLSSVGCCRLVLALDSHVGDGCRRSFAGGSRFSKRTFVTGYYRPGGVIRFSCGQGRIRNDGFAVIEPDLTSQESAICRLLAGRPDVTGACLLDVQQGYRPSPH
jgi:hypothetical protein